MVSKKAVRTLLPFHPLHSVLYVINDNIIQIASEKIKIKLVGEKAYGLSCLPKSWTLPFFVVSGDLLFQYANCSEKSRKELLNRWSTKITEAALSGGIKNFDDIIVRSSGYSEGLEERGKFYSVAGSLNNLTQPLGNCLKELLIDDGLKDKNIPLVIQKYVDPVSQKGHFSNERRFCEENRDWIGEFEGIGKGGGIPFQINLRNWRKKIVTERHIHDPLTCNLSAHVSEVLKIPATWAYERKLRIHFEWVWDGNLIYLVQADQEREAKGIDPTNMYKYKTQTASTFIPRCLKEVNQEHALKYHKIRNVFTYEKLGLPIAKLYVLDDQSVIENLTLGNICQDLEDDISDLVKGSLVIRMDIATQDQRKRQMLPRTQEERDLDKAIKWLKEKSAEVKSEIQDELVFIFHNFVPAVSSAFAYAAPGERKVQIEALWGLPEGLYYNAHDKYIIDTKKSQEDELHVDHFQISRIPKYKQFFISPDEDGKWTAKKVKPPYDWNEPIQNEEWIKEIALQSRRIAKEEDKSLSIMWFVDVSKESCESRVFPWHHEYYNPKLTNRVREYRTKTPFDKSLIIRTEDDIKALEQEVSNAKSNVRRVRIQPNEDALLRNKYTLRDIGELTQKIDAVILLEGGILSHAYYQLMETNAIVEVIHPFDDLEDKREFNKLVRDKVTSNIEEGGEVVNKAKLSGEALLRALREKLIEEAFEVLDAVDQKSIVEELADVNEVIDGILSHLNVSRNELAERQEHKYKKAGGFKKGIVLLDTRNPLPTKADFDNGTLFDGINFNDGQDQLLDEQMIVESSQKIDKWNDKREHGHATEAITSLVIPMVRDNWTTKKIIDLNSNNSLRVKITGERLGPKFKIELSIFAPHKQHEQLKLIEFNRSEDE